MKSALNHQKLMYKKLLKEARYMQSQIRMVRSLVPKEVLTLEEQLEKDEVGF